MQAYVISLDRRADRYATFKHDVALPCERVRVPAVDGQNLRDDQLPPEWWQPRNPRGLAAWACMQSHVRAWRWSLNAGHDMNLFFEDDASPTESAAMLFDVLLCFSSPDYAEDILYLGGQLLKTGKHKPARLHDGLYQCVNVNRLHAYAMHRSATERALSAVSDAIALGWPSRLRMHVDHLLGYYSEQCVLRSIAPSHWLFGQRAGRSDIDRNTWRERIWKNCENCYGQRAPDLV